MADLTDALARLLAPWDLHHLITDWDGHYGWRYQTSHGNTASELSATGSYPGITWQTPDQPKQFAPWAEVHKLIRHIPAAQAANLAAACETYRTRPTGADRTEGQTAAAALADREMRAAAAACWEATREVDVQLDLFAGLGAA